MRRSSAAFVAFVTAATLAGCASTAAPTGVTRMYVFDCGESHIPDISPWSPGVDVGKPAVFSDNCYLIRHGADWMLWDSGYPDALADTPAGVAGARGMTQIRTRTLVSQMREIGAAPSDVTIVAFSHSHGDHVGNGNLFASATLYIQRAEYEAAFGPDAARYGLATASFDRFRDARVVKLEGDRDVFGDGSVVIVSTPGHTPGHQSLLVRLPKTGPVVLSGDVAHFRSNFDARRVPGFNFDVAQSKASMEKVDALVKAEHAQLWINHDAVQSATIVHAPGYVE